MIACRRGWSTLLHSPRPCETCPVAAVTVSSDVATNDIRLSLWDGEAAVLDEDGL
jgi:hypothetical protein